MPRTLIPTFYTPQRRATLMAPGILPDQRRQWRQPQMPYGASQSQAGSYVPPMMPQQVDPSQRPLNQFGRPTGMSPNFLASIQTNRAAQGIQRNRQANALQAKRAGIVAAGGSLTAGSPAMPMTGSLIQRDSAEVRAARDAKADAARNAMVDALPGGPKVPDKPLVDPAWAEKMRAGRLGVPMKPVSDTTGTPPVMPMQEPMQEQRMMSMQVENRPAVQHQRGESTQGYADAVMQQERNANVMANRGISIPAVPFRQQQTAVEGVPMGFTTPITRPLVPPAGNYGLSQDQLSSIQRDADQQAYIQYQHEMGELQNPPPPMMPVPADVLKQQVAMGQQQVGYERTRANDAQKSAQVPRVPGQAVPADDTVGALKVYNDTANDKDDATAYWGKQQRGAWQTRQDQKRAASTQPSATTTQPAGKGMTPELARQFIQQAGGDKNKAREMARQAGYTF